MRKPLWVLLLVSLVVVSVSPVAGASSPEYLMTEIGDGHAVAVNNRGEVAATAVVGGESHLVLWDGGEVVDLGPLPWDHSMVVLPSAISERGDIVGEFQLLMSSDSKGFLWRAGKWTQLLADGAAWSQAVDVNARGQVLGREQGFYPGVKAFIWEDGQFTYLDVPYAIAQAINNRGQVVGFYFDFTDPESMIHSFLWDDDTVTAVADSGAIDVTVLDVNEHGQIVGFYGAAGAGPQTPFIWQRGELIELPDWGFGAAAQAINNRGQVAGSARSAEYDLHAVLWDEGQIIDLGTLGDGCIATGLNEQGQVVGYCWTDDGTKTFLWER